MAFIVVIVLGLFSAFLAGNVASDKGHDGTLWFLAGLLLGPLGLIAAAGLSDRKLRRYIRQIGVKQEAITPEPLRITAEDVKKAKGKWSFIASKEATKDQIFEKLVNLLKENNSSELIGRIDTERLEINSPIFGSDELIVEDEKGKTIASVTSSGSLPEGTLWQVELS